MILKIEKNLIIINSTVKMTWDTFKYLTGLNINLEKRIGKSIELIRKSGHLYAKDFNFIAGSKYKNKEGKIFKCVIVNEIEALLTESNLTFKYTKNNAKEFTLI